MSERWAYSIAGVAHIVKTETPLPAWESSSLRSAPIPRSTLPGWSRGSRMIGICATTVCNILLWARQGRTQEGR